jgi:2-polyprenyl-3-methyl-5-hydroxy-6-metoxy-1,4-benzoquinol methylase
MDIESLGEGEYWENVIAKMGEEGMDFRRRSDFVSRDPKVYWEDGELTKRILAYPYSALRALVGPGKRVLDLGSGSGGIAYMLASLGADVLGVDIQENTIARLNREVAKETELKLKFEVADLNRVEFPANSFDVVVSWNTFHHIKETDHLISVIKKALKPDGVFVLLEHDHRHSLLRNILAAGFWIILPTREKFLAKLKLIFARARGKGGEALSPAEDCASEDYLKKISHAFRPIEKKSFLGFTTPFIARIRGGKFRWFFVGMVNALDRLLIRAGILRGEQLFMVLRNRK